MRNINFSSRKMICCIFGIILLWTFGACVAALPPDPDNAALLYYQAFLLRPKPDDAAEVLVYNATQEQIYKVLRGGKFEPDANTKVLIDDLKERLDNRVAEPNEKMPDIERQLYFYDMALYDELIEPYEKVRDVDPNEKIRGYLEDCQETIKYAEAAAQLPQCNWGLWYSQGHGPSTELLIQLRSLTRILNVDAIILTADGDYRAALGRCLTIRRLAGHVGDDTLFSYAVSVGLETSALHCVQHVLGSMPTDVNTLTWLKNQLAATRSAPKSPARAMKVDFELMLQAMRTNDKTLPWLRDQLAKDAEDAVAKKKIRSLTDEELLARARKPYAKFLNSVLRAMDSNMPYEQTYTEIQKLAESLKEQSRTNPAIILSMRISADGMVGMYCCQIRHTAYLNAFKAAIEMYLAIAKTGELPDTLPDGLPKDPFSGQDFEYEITKDGFVLHCRGKDIPGGGIRPLEFKVQR